MNDTVLLSLVAFGGAACGAGFFGGLWWTIRHRLHSDHAELWFLGSALIRTAGVISAFLWMGHDDWRRWLACVAGFVVMRVITQCLGRPRHPPRHLFAGRTP